jgi:hypothetical protein
MVEEIHKGVLIREVRSVSWLLAKSRVNIYSSGYLLEKPRSDRSILRAVFILELLFFLAYWLQRSRDVNTSTKYSYLGRNSRPTSTFRGILGEITSRLCEYASDILKLRHERTTW